MYIYINIYIYIYNYNIWRLFEVQTALAIDDGGGLKADAG